MPKRRKSPLCSLETVFNHPDIASICQRIDLIADLMDQYDDHDPINEKLADLANELQHVVSARAFEHMNRAAAYQFLEEWDQLSANHRFAALLSIHRRNMAAAQQGDEG